MMLWHGTAGEFALLTIATGTWFIVAGLLQTTWTAYRAVTVGPAAKFASAREREDLRMWVLQEFVRFVAASTSVAAGLAAVWLEPPPGTLSAAAQWKLWALIVYTSLLGTMSLLAWRARQ